MINSQSVCKLLARMEARNREFHNYAQIMVAANTRLCRAIQAARQLIDGEGSEEELLRIATAEMEATDLLLAQIAHPPSAYIPGASPTTTQ